MCVAKCPKETYSPLLTVPALSEEEKKLKMKPYCKAVAADTFANKSLSELVTAEICPPWLLAS